MKIAFCGTHVTGKTTLLRDVETYFQNNLAGKHTFGYITGIARSIIQRGFPLNKDGNIYSYVNYINDQLNAEKYMGKYDFFISDRTILSPLAYALVNRSLPRPFIPDYLIEMIENIWVLEKERYDLYVYFPIEFSVELRDDIHPFDEKYRRMVDEMIVTLLKKYSVNFVTIRGNRDERKKKILNLMGIDRKED